MHDGSVDCYECINTHCSYEYPRQFLQKVPSNTAQQNSSDRCVSLLSDCLTADDMTVSKAAKAGLQQQEGQLYPVIHSGSRLS